MLPCRGDPQQGVERTVAGQRGAERDQTQQGQVAARRLEGPIESEQKDTHGKSNDAVDGPDVTCHLHSVCYKAGTLAPAFWKRFQIQPATHPARYPMVAVTATKPAAVPSLNGST